MNLCRSPFLRTSPTATPSLSRPALPPLSSFFFIIFQNDVEGGVRLRAVGEVKLLTFIHPESTHCHGDCELYVF